MREDKYCNELKDGDIIDINKTVNGCSEFVVLTVEPLDIVYNFDRDYKYEYNKEELLQPEYEGTVDWEIIGNIHEATK